MVDRIRSLIVAVPFLAAAGCTSDAPVSPSTGGAHVATEVVGAPVYSAATGAVEALGTYHFTVPADFNDGIFGIQIDNHVSFAARNHGNGGVTGRFRYVQSAGGEDFIFSGTVTCLAIYDTPVLERYPEITAKERNRAKWGGLIENSNDPTLPAGIYIWFQSIDNNGESGSSEPDLSTLSGFGGEAANEAFCASGDVPNTRFGPHPIESGQIIVD